MLKDILDLLNNIPPDFTLIITTPHKNHISTIKSLIVKTNKIEPKIIITENKGRDVAPFLAALNSIDLKQYDLVYKVHTKKSSYLTSSTNQSWADTLLQETIGSKQTVSNIINAFVINNYINMISAKEFISNDMGSCKKNFDRLLKTFQIHFNENLTFVAGTIFWVRAESLIKLQNKTINFDKEAGWIDGKTEHALERIFGVLATQNGSIISTPIGFVPANELIKPIACYLPQFHQIPENDAWWGKGFTEWTNLKKAVPLFEGHQISRPHPELGEYNLLDKDTRAKQAEIAKKHGIYGFAYYHYWFKGKRLLNKPLELMLDDGEPNIPFYLTWANESWTRTWDGLNSQLLIKQDYGDQNDWLEHIKYLTLFFTHPNYIKHNNKPVLSIYRIGNINDFPKMLKVWNSYLNSVGIDGLCINAIAGNFEDSNIKLNDEYFAHIDFMTTFEPNFSGRFNLNIGSTPTTRSITQAWESIEELCQLNKKHLRGTFVSWDNTPRKETNGSVFLGGTPKLFKAHLSRLIDKYSAEIASTDNNPGLMLINAWNEWAEGAVLEPTTCFKAQYLEALNETLEHKTVVKTNLAAVT